MVQTGLSLTSCFTSSSSFIEEQTGVAVVRGRITRVENLTASKTEHLGDGLAITVAQPGCSISMQFGTNQSKVIQLAVGEMIVYGADTDYLVRATAGSPTK